MDNKQPIKLFYSYSHKDEALRDELEKHLKILQREGFIDTWHDKKINAGDEWEKEIDKNLEQAEIILLLISSDFIASDYCYNNEMSEALKRHNEGNAVVIPVILRDCLWQNIAPFSKLQAIPSEGKAIMGESWHNQDKAFTETAQQLKKKIEELWRKKESQSSEIIVDALNYEVKKTFEIKAKDIPVVKKYFAGRNDELTKLKEAFDNNPFILIEGAGGIGKTQLVARFIANEGIRDRVVWFVCTPTSQPDDMIRGAGFEEILKGENKPEREKFSAFKDKIQEHDRVMILDNYQEVEGKDNFKSFLLFINEYLSKGHVIIIGRDNVAGLSSVQPKRIHIEGLGDNSLQHAQGLIDHLYPDCNVSDEVLQNICTQLQGYPLAIDLAVNLLSLGTSPEQIIQVAIKQARAGNNTIEEIVERLLNAIFTRPDATEDEKNFLKWFSVFRGKTEEAAARAIIPDAIFDKASQNLKHKNILNTYEGYYELHPLIREFCYQQLEEKAPTHVAAASYYVALRNNEFNADLEEKIYGHLAIAGHWDEISQTIVSSGREFILKGYLDQLQQMINEVRKHSTSAEIFEILEGDVAEITGRWKQAMVFFEQATKSDNEKVRIEAIIKRGEMLFRLGDTKAAKVIFEQAIEDTKGNNGQKEWYARAVNDLGLVYFNFENFKEALRLTNIALSIREDLVNLNDIAVSMYNIANIKARAGQHTEALEIIENVLNNGKKIESKVLLGKYFAQIGSIKIKMKQNRGAMAFYEKALNIHNEVGDKSSKSVTLNDIGFLECKFGEDREGLKHFEMSLKISEEIGDIGQTAVCLHNIATTFINKNDDLCLACFYLIKSIALDRKIGNRNTLSQLSWLNGIKEKKGISFYKEKVKEAYNKLDETLKKYVDINEILGEPRKAEPKIGRNDPCPCGSGKKYKNCCGRGE